MEPERTAIAIGSALLNATAEQDDLPLHDLRDERAGTVVDDRADCRGAKLGEALAIRGEKAGGSRSEVDKWLRRIGLVHA
jgi:hypothetical protein